MAVQSMLNVVRWMRRGPNSYFQAESDTTDTLGWKSKRYTTCIDLKRYTEKNPMTVVKHFPDFFSVTVKKHFRDVRPFFPDG